MKDYRILKRVERYSVTNEKGVSLPIKLYGVKDNGIRVFFCENKSKRISNLIFFPKEQIVGLPDGGIDDFFFIGKYYAVQKSKNFDSFMIIFIQNEFAQDIQKDSFPIKYFRFEDNKITFNSFGALQQYGEKVILKFK